MRLSTKGRFAVMAMIDIALRHDFGSVPLADIASRHPISLSYLEQLFSKLRQKGLVTSSVVPAVATHWPVRAKTSRWRTSSLPSKKAPPKLSRKNLHPKDLTQDLWDNMNVKVLNFTQSVTLKKLVLDQFTLWVKIEVKPAPNRGSSRSRLSNSFGPMCRTRCLHLAGRCRCHDSARLTVSAWG